MNEERRVDIAELKMMIKHNNEMTERLSHELLGNNGTPGLITKCAVIESEIGDMQSDIKDLKSFKWKDRSIGAITGFVGGITAVLGKSLLSK